MSEHRSRRDAPHRWPHRESHRVPPDEQHRDVVEELLPRLHLARHAMRRPRVDQLRRLHRDGRLRPRCAVSRVLDRRPIRLRSLNVGWRDHRRRFGRDYSAHYPNEADPNGDDLNHSLVDWTDQNRFAQPNPIAIDPTIPSENLSLNSNPILSAILIPTERALPSVRNRLKHFDFQGDLSPDQPNSTNLSPSNPIWVRPLPTHGPVPLCPRAWRRLGGRWTCPSATNWTKKDWPSAQPTGPTTHFGKRVPRASSQSARRARKRCGTL